MDVWPTLMAFQSADPVLQANLLSFVLRKANEPKPKPKPSRTILRPFRVVRGMKKKTIQKKVWHSRIRRKVDGYGNGARVKL
jgi:hypothetical protein